MELVTYDDVTEYAARVLPLLDSDEPRYNLALAVISSLISGRLVPDRPPLLAVISDGESQAAVLHTPPHGLLLTGLPSGAAGQVVDRVLVEGYRPPLVVGPPEAVDPVVDAWRARTGDTVEAVRRQGVYALSRLIEPSPPSGAARAAADADCDLVHSWFTAFGTELDLRPRTRADQVRARVVAGDITLWTVADEPVSMAGVGGRTPRGVRIGPVYTPPEQRGRGYAAAVTAAVTRAQLAAGAERCFLYTDLDNPTSNGIYRRLGYEWVCESREVTFAPATG
ncbi:MAG TPA: GNAT family N-acetyltransferase [Mycobacteriales bacterium]|nr:GNAT family N-acetyltransferase [Mycobacteriales bacterium]